MAHAAACAVADNPGRRRTTRYFVHGDVGLGKTHLLQAICLRIMCERPAGAKIFFTSRAKHFMTQVHGGR